MVQDSDMKCVFERKTASYTDATSRFDREEDNYTKQFASLYVKRLEELSSILKVKLKSKWGKF